MNGIFFGIRGGEKWVYFLSLSQSFIVESRVLKNGGLMYRSYLYGLTISLLFAPRRPPRGEHCFWNMLIVYLLKLIQMITLEIVQGIQYSLVVLAILRQIVQEGVNQIYITVKATICCGH